LSSQPAATDRSIPVGIVPLVRANNIARSLAIARTPAELAEQWRAGRVHSFHLVEVTYGRDKRELCAEGTAALIKRRKGKKARGADDIRRGRRALTALASETEQLELQVNIDGGTWKSDLISVDVLNIPFTGPALPLAANADPGDTLLDVIGFEKDKRDELVEWIKRPQAPRRRPARGAESRSKYAGATPTVGSMMKWRKASRNGSRRLFVAIQSPCVFWSPPSIPLSNAPTRGDRT
jgi:hypothetical protein